MSNHGNWYYSSTQWKNNGGRNDYRYGKIHNYSEVTDNYTQDNFKSSNYIKRFMYEHLIYNGYNGIVETNDGTNILYRFNGIITSYDNGKIPIGTTVSDDTNLRFRYTTNYNYESGERGTIKVYLEKLSPADAIKQTETSVNNPTTENGFTQIASSTTELPYAYNVRYTDLIGLMQSGYIYRLQIGFVVEDTNEDVLSLNRVKSVDVCTSEFFSLNNWKSSVISVKNIYQYAFPNDPDITQENENNNNTGIDLTNIERWNRNDTKYHRKY